MFCRNCGAEIPDDSKFCALCGQSTDKEINTYIKDYFPPSPEEKTKKRSNKGKSGEIKPPPLIMRIILTVCSVILLCVTVGSLLVNFVGKEAEATILDTSIYKKLENEKYLYSWTVTYEFYANGRKYVDSDEITGPRGSVNTFGYHVSYLSFAPEISRLTRGNSVSELHRFSDILKMGTGSVLSFILYIFVCYFMLWVAFPKLPFFGFGKIRKRKQRRRD